MINRDYNHNDNDSDGCENFKKSLCCIFHFQFNLAPIHLFYVY